MLRLFVMCLGIALPAGGLAAEIWSCTSTSATMFTNYAGIDQILLDRDAQTIDMRIASTMGTSQEVQYIFSNRGTAADELSWKHGEGADVVSGTRFGGAFLFTRIGNEMGITSADKIPHSYEGWRCRR